MKKIVVFILIIVMSFGMSSCSVIHGVSHDVYRINQATKVDKEYKQLGENRAKAIVDALKSKDTNALKKMFSKNSVSKIDQIDSKLKTFVDYCQGNYVSYEYSITKNSVNETETVITNYVFISYITDKNTYIIGCADITLDTGNKNNTGVYDLDVYNYADVGKTKSHPADINKPDITWELN